MKILVAGGGIGGLSLALSLHATGLDDVEVYEAAPAVEELGVGINVLPHAVRELTELGLSEDLEAAGMPTGEFVMFNKHGQKIWGEPRGLSAGYHWPQFSIHRGRLLRILHRAFLERLGDDRLHTGRRVVTCSSDEARCAVRFGDGSTALGDVVVAADGVHSQIRSVLYPDEGPVLWNGITMWRAIARSNSFLTGSSMVIIGYFGRRAVVYPIEPATEDGTQLINVVLEATTAEERPMPRQSWSHEVDRAEIRALFGSMRYDWLDVGHLIDAAEQWWQYPMVDRDPLPRWSFGRITLLGDAAHPMYPVGSNGASQAIIDGRVLARALALESDVQLALTSYDDQRRPATAAVVMANREVGAERCMELAEERAPGGFDRIDDVFGPGELEQLSARYKAVAGFDPTVLNARPSLSVPRWESRPSRTRPIGEDGD